MIINKLIKVTAEDIKNGMPGRADKCAVALALTREGFANVMVDDNHAQFDYKGEEDVTSELPKDVQLFIAAFDERKPVEPFEFVLE